MLETIQHDGETIRLFRLQPQLDQGRMRIEHVRRTIQPRTRTKREHGSEAYESIRHRISLPYVLARARAQQLCEILGQLAHERVAIPLWPAMTSRSAVGGAIYTADYLLNFDAAGYAFRPATELVDYQREYVAPVIVGYLEGKPKLTRYTDQLATVTLTLLEDSPYELRVSPNTNGLAPFTDQWPATLRPSGSAAATGVDDIIELIPVDRGRERPVEGDEAPPSWWQEATFQLQGPDAIRTLLAWWDDRKGRLRKFATPMWFRPGEDTTITPHNTVARFGSDTLTLDYVTTGHAETSIRLQQLPWEHLGLPNPGSVGPTIVYLLEFIYKVPGAPKWRFTNHERRIESSEGVTWKSEGSFSLRRPKQQLGIGKEVWELSCYRPPSSEVEDNPLLLTIPNQLEGELECRIYEADLANPAAMSLECVGNVIPESSQGRRINFRVGSFTTLLDRKVPSFRVQRQCNYQVFTRLCGLSESAHRVQTTITSISGSSITVASTGPRPVLNGRVWGGTGLGYEQRPIMSQAGNRLDLIKPLRKLQVGDVIYVIPGCAGTPEACQAYGNYRRFGGHPHVPVENNPSITPIQGDAVSLAKK